LIEDLKLITCFKIAFNIKRIIRILASIKRSILWGIKKFNFLPLASEFLLSLLAFAVGGTMETF
jgi:hypothetical protein